MLDVLDRAGAPASLGEDAWVDRGLRWVTEPRKHAPVLDSLLIWAHGAGADLIEFMIDHPVWVGVYGRMHRATHNLVDEGEMAMIVNHLYGADGMARLQGCSDFDISYQISLGRTERLRFRVNASPTTTSRGHGVDITLRPIADLPPPLADQLVEPGILESFRVREGMVIVSGATGSGKSTLIAGMTMAKLLDPEGHLRIKEAAAPIEFLLDRVKSQSSTINQTEVPRDLPSFDAFIRGCMRRHPTDILVGECRDDVTMAAAIDAAISGHALTTTLHAKDVGLTMQRIESFCPAAERQNKISAVAQSLRLVINQRLARATDGKRTALREFLVFDSCLRNKLIATDPSQWPSLTRKAVEEQGQSYKVAIENALRAGRISRETAAYELRMIE